MEETIDEPSDGPYDKKENLTENDVMNYGVSVCWFPKKDARCCGQGEFYEKSHQKCSIYLIASDLKHFYRFSGISAFFCIR